MKETRMKLLHLHRCRGVTRPLIRKVLHDDPPLDNLYKYSIDDFRKLFSLPDKRTAMIYQDLHSSRVFSQLRRDLNTFHTVTILDNTYPALLRNIPDCPIVLYLCGDSDLLSHAPSLSVVGTRNPTSDAYSKMNNILTPLIKEGWVIVSGMAMGIDAMAHRLALCSRGKTIAILGGGFRHIYPKSNISMFRALTETQLVVSEYPPGIPPRRHHFPERNRIISGLTFGTLVVEAKERSGSLITVNQALEQGREVFAMPGSPTQPETDGCNKMIQDGAKLVRKTYDILEEWQ
ncbi:DNA-processing protein DprA [Sediminibacillus halophilus]|uniref:DNA processing protein n=1 Tax=Sediminibacillus halophilus TaxID=482461 RepID=A0A1G9MLG6_9BACI|nr:DNA-processing protein DprA [Sediminibacillus halophilus]SDL74495.1 DNA processing protein [Sediminibacillus halophilus]